ncbi:MAG: bile acid-coenzyme ligase, partial [Pseudonocardiales bacterium]|nr:bile acid-coenzyme ligase [Pseudonocardiales bacterium]
MLPDMPATPFFDAVRRHAAASPDRPSLTVGDTTLTRAELVASVERVAVVFAERGVGEGSWVTIAMPNGIEFVQSALAAWLLGATPQPISPRLPAVERAAIIELADPALVVGAQDAEAGGRPVLSTAEIIRVAADPSAPRLGADAVLSPEWKVVTSGGSTGRPKLIVATSPADAEAIGALGMLLHVR